MTFNNFIKMSPILGITGIGGGPIGLPLVGGSAGLPYFGGRGVFASGNDGNSGWTYANVIDYITISSTGNATDFGDLTLAPSGTGSFNGNGRGCCAAGWDENASGPTNVIGYITIASAGNATDFGDLTVARRLCKGMSDGTIGVWSCGLDASTNSNVIDYVTVATTGNASDFGDLFNKPTLPAGCSDSHGGLAE